MDHGQRPADRRRPAADHGQPATLGSHRFNFHGLGCRDHGQRGAANCHRLGIMGNRPRLEVIGLTSTGWGAGTTASAARLTATGWGSRPVGLGTGARGGARLI